MNTTIISRRAFSFCLGSAMLLASAVLAGCSSETKPEPEATEIKLSENNTSDAPEASMFTEAKRLYRAGLYSVAQDSFDALRLNHPTSPYVEFAEIKVADSHFESRDFAVAAGLYEQFTKSHPASRAVPYMLLRAGRSNQLVNQGVGRDTAPLEKAVGFYSQLIEKFPSTIYAEDAKVWLAETRTRLAQYENFVMNYYRKRSNTKALEARQREFEKNFKEVPLVVADRSTSNQPAEPLVVASHTIPAGPKLLNVKHVTSADRAAKPLPIAALGSKTQSPGLTPKSAEIPTSATGYRLERVTCSQQRAFVFLNQALIDPDFESRYRLSLPVKGSIKIQLPMGIAKPTTMDCFAKNDLNISEKGEITLTTTRSASVMTLDNPPRLMLALQ